MSFSRFPGQGPNFVPAYQVSGVPFVTGSNGSTELGTSTPIKIEFPFVTRWIQVRNVGSNQMKIGFTENGVLGNPERNYYILESSAAAASHSLADTDRWEVRCKEIYLLAEGGTTGFSVVAGLTGIESFPVITGSNGFKGVG